MADLPTLNGISDSRNDLYNVAKFKGAQAELYVAPLGRRLLIFTTGVVPPSPAAGDGAGSPAIR